MPEFVVAADHLGCGPPSAKADMLIATNHEPDLRFIIPAANENRWSDLLAALITTDPKPMARFVGAEPDVVRREVVMPGHTGRRSDRLDLLLSREGQQLAAIEVKVLSDLGRDQLVRYRTAFPEVRSYHVLHLGRLPLTITSAAPWQSLTWEAVLTAYSASGHPWAASTASAWLKQLDALVPRVDTDTVWNDIEADDATGIELELRAHVAWLFGRLTQWCSVEHALEISSGGGAWVAAMRTPAHSPEHKMVAELQEGLAAADWRSDPARPYRNRVKGPAVLIGLNQYGVSTSAGFDWILLHDLFRRHVLDASDQPARGPHWQTTSARLRDATDKANWQAMVDAGAPTWLGKGYGMATARTHHVCAFGARLQLAPTLTLGEVDSYLQGLQALLIDMASTPRGSIH